MKLFEKSQSIRGRWTGGLRASLSVGAGYLLLSVLVAIASANFSRAEIPERTSDEPAAERECDRESVTIEIDAAENRLYLLCGKEVLLAAPCSTGSGDVLRTEDMTWWFDTPRGNFQIESIARDPVWRKPDWAYLEEGTEIPSDEDQRLVPGALGEFALMIEEGLFIHGTLYERLLGESVTHGCIRLGSRDLAFLVENVGVGTPVLIYDGSRTFPFYFMVRSPNDERRSGKSERRTRRHEPQTGK